MLLRNGLLLSADSDAGTGAAQPTGQDATQQLATEPEADNTQNASVEVSGGKTETTDGQPETSEGASKLSATVNFEEIAEHVKSTVAEEMKKAAMNDAEREKYEFEQRTKQLDEREKDLSVRELKANTVRLLAEKGLPSSAASVVMGADMKETSQNIKIFQDSIDKEVQRQVAERLKGKAPASGNVTQGEADSVKSQFLQGLSGV